MQYQPSNLVAVGLGLVAALVVTAQAQDQTGREGQGVTVTGCLTARPGANTYALTPIKPSPVTDAVGKATSDVRSTFTYELVGRSDELRGHIGKIVTAKGRVDPKAGKEADIQAEQKATVPPAGTEATPNVKTKEQAEIEVRRLHVTSVTSEGRPCPTAPRS